MQWWSSLKRWLGFEAPVLALESVDIPPTAERFDDDDPSIELEITLQDVADGAILRDIVATPRTQSFSSPIVDELAGRLRIMARRSTGEDDRSFFASLRRKVINDGFDLRTMPKAIVPIQRMLGAPDVAVDALAAQLTLEPSIATRVVAIANCSLFGGQGRVGSVGDAVVRLGLVETRNIVLAITAQAKLFRLPGKQSEADALFRHALASAVAGKVVATDTGCAPGEVGFIACLLSELGRVVVFSEAADIRRVSRGRIDPDPKVVDATSEELHGSISALIAESWQFEVSTVSAIQYHHRPSSAPPEVRHLSQLMFVADDLASRAIHPERRRDMSFGLLSARKALGVSDDIERFVELTRVELEELERLMVEPTRGGPPVRGKVM